MTASAQIGGSGWSSQSISYNVQKPYNVSTSSRFTDSNGVYHCWVYSTDASFQDGSTTLPRTEMRFNPDFTSGEIQYQAMLMAPANENSYCIMQDHTGDSQSSQYGPVAIMFIWQSKDGGSIWNGYTGHELAKNMGGVWFQLNVDHNIVTHTIKAWINSQQVVSESDNGATDYYFKNGVYEQNISTPSAKMDTYIQNIQEWTSSGKNSGGGSFSGSYELECVASGLAANVKGASTSDDAPVVQYPFGGGSSNAIWTFVATSNGYYQVQNQNSGLDMNVNGASTAKGALITQAPFGSSGDDQWKPSQNSDGSYTLTNLHSGLVLDDPGGSTSSNVQLDQYSSQGGTNQEWDIVSQ
ncbi:MAG TPA: RICIN domain-containing protein [Candidatus Methylacidiphilales bacterium]|nr:RICIN domain-containing protein [Candidatus Methylacidiphilales bacterium]